jgi:hypothetical protein
MVCGDAGFSGRAVNTCGAVLNELERFYAGTLRRKLHKGTAQAPRKHKLKVVIPTKAGIHFGVRNINHIAAGANVMLDSRLRGNDDFLVMQRYLRRSCN